MPEGILDILRRQLSIFGAQGGTDFSFRLVHGSLVLRTQLLFLCLLVTLIVVQVVIVELRYSTRHVDEVDVTRLRAGEARMCHAEACTVDNGVCSREVDYVSCRNRMSLDYRDMSL